MKSQSPPASRPVNAILLRLHIVPLKLTVPVHIDVPSNVTRRIELKVDGNLWVTKIPLHASLDSLTF